MWADSLLAAERAHLVRLVVWGGTSVVYGTILLAWLRAARRSAPLLSHFAIQSAAWGVIDVLIAAVAWRGLAVRDLAAAVKLDRFIWLNIGLDAGYILVGVTLAITGWRLARRAGLVGAGLGVATQGGALLFLDLVLAGGIDRLG